MFLLVSCAVAVWASLQLMLSDDQLPARARVGMFLRYLDLSAIWFRLLVRWPGWVVSFSPCCLLVFVWLIRCPPGPG